MLGKLKSFNVSTNVWIVIGTLTILVLFYIFYLEYHIASQESRIISTRFRVLDQFGDNIDAKINSYQANANQLGSLGLSDAKKKAEPSDYSENAKFLSDHLNKDLEIAGIKYDQGYSNFSIMPKNLEGNNTLIKTKTDEYFYFDPVQINVDSVITDLHSIFVRTEYNNLIKGLQRNDVFDGLFILRDSQIVYSTLDSDLLLGTVKDNIEHINASAENEQVDNLLKHDELIIPTENDPVLGHIYSGEFLDITISNKKYKLFFKPVKIKGQQWFLCGLMESANYNAAKRSISPWVIILSSLVLILILLSLPIIKLKVISKIEYLETSTITTSALSILLGSSAIMLFLMFLTQNTVNLQNTDHKLQEFSTQIDSLFYTEIEDAYDQLMEYDSVYDSFHFDEISKYPKGPIDTNILNISPNDIRFPDKYKYADYLFWIKKNGTQSAYLTPFKKVGTLSDLKNRDYFKKKDEWFLPSDSTKKFRLESILSLTSGNHKVAMSTSSNVEDNPVIATSSRFYSIIDPIVPKNYGYSIIDESGKVWFHSNKNRNLMENFIHECNDDGFLKSAIYSRTGKAINVNYYNKPHRVFIQPINKLPLYLVTFYNKNADTSFHAQVFTLTLIILSAFFFFMFIQIIILMAMERQLQWKLSKNLIMKITRPMIHLKNHYKFLFWIYLIVASITIALLSQFDMLQSIIIIYSLEIIIFAFSYRVLNHNQAKIRRRKWFTIINLGILILIDLGLLYVSGFHNSIGVLGYQAILILLLEISYGRLRTQIEKYTHSFNEAFIRVYVLFLISIAIIFAVIPTLKFYEIGYNIESEIRLRHNQVDLMKKREDRNMNWNKYYASQVIQTPTTNSILKMRRDKGSYTSFLNELDFSTDPVNRDSIEENPYKPSILNSLVVSIRPIYDDEIIENKYLIISGQNNSNLSWYNYANNKLVLKYLSQTEDPKFENLCYHHIIGRIDGLNFIVPFHGNAFTGTKNIIFNILYVALFIFIFYILYFLIKFGIRNIYSLDIVKNYSHEFFGETVRHQMLANKDIFIVRLSAKDETNRIEKGLLKDIYLDWSDEKTIEDSAIKITNGLAAKNAALKKSENTLVNKIEGTGTIGALNSTFTVFIDHFDWRFDDPNLFKKKLDVLWAFINRDDIRLIIVSQIHANKIIEYYRGIVEKSDSVLDESTSKDFNFALCLKNLTEFTQFTGNIIINYLPVRFNFSWEDEDRLCLRSKSKMSFPGLIKSELEASDYLEQFKDAVTKYYETYCVKQNKENPEELIITKINSLVDSYYEDIFNACSDEEKYVLYDLAKDLIMNQKNSKAIYGLLQKGLLIKKCDKINFMNVSFRSFVMSRLTVENTSALELKIGKETGTWKGYKFTLIIIILALFIFIAMANQNFLDNLNQLFIAIGGGIAVITGILGLLSRKNSSENG